MQRCRLRDVIGNLTRVDHHVVGQENEQLHRWIAVHKADDILGDHLFRDEVRAFLDRIAQGELHSLIHKQTENKLEKPVTARGFEIRHD